jgi:hypothetical protein
MQMPSLATPAGRKTFPGRTGRWLLLLALSVLLHVLLLAAADRGIATPDGIAPSPVIAARLIAPVPAPAVATPASAPPAPAPAPPRQRKARPTPRLPPAPPTETPQAKPPATTATLATAQDMQLPSEVPSDAPAAEPTPAPETMPDPAMAGPKVPAAPPAQDVPPAPQSPHYRVSLPPSATLAYEVRYSTRGSITRGSSIIAWQAGDAAYTIRGEVTKFGFALSSFRSEGAIDAAGIAPTLYAEKNARRSETNTHFSRDARQAISFSASAETYPLTAGAQDRGSILWQLSGIGRGDPSVLVPGTVLDIFVAGVRDAEHWLIAVVGEETIPLENGAVRAWHLVRAPRAGTYDKRIDMWLAPALQWYPVKLRYTEVSGDYLDLSLNEVR